MRVRREQHGFALLEVLAAGLILAIALAGLAGILIGAQGQASAEVTQNQLVSAADQQIEQVRSSVATGGFDDLALTATPTPFSTATINGTWVDPAEYVHAAASCGYGAYLDIKQSYALSGSAAPPGFTSWANCGSDGEPLQVLSGGIVTVPTGSAPPTCSATVIYSACTETLSTGVLVTLDTLVTDTYVGCGTNAQAQTGQSCPLVTAGTVTNCTANSTSLPSFPTTVASSTSCADARRVTVAALAGSPTNAAAVPTPPVYISTVFTDPTPAAVQQGQIGVTVGAGL